MDINILKLITKFEGRERPRLNMLYEYYNGRHAILNAVKPSGKPNNRIATNFAKNIVNNTTGYLLGRPVTYNCADEKLSKAVQDITVYNDDAFTNTQISKDLSIFGRAAELLYIDDDLKVRYAKINPMNLIVKRYDDIESEIEFAIRWYDVFDEDDKRTRYIEVYTADKVDYYTFAGTLTHTGTKRHYFGLVPVNEYQNNDDRTGDFEDVISLIDAYNVMQSESVNDFQAFADAYLLLKNIVVDEETEQKLRSSHVIETYEDGDASFMVKQVNDSYVENIKDRLQKDIYIASNTVNMSDENFSQNASGVSIEYKLMNFENRVSVTERYFKRGLQRRFEMICNFLNNRGTSYDYTDITPVFARNIPRNVPEIVTEVVQLDGIVSKRTLLALLPFVEDVDRELDELSKEREQYDVDNFGQEDVGMLNGDDEEEPGLLAEEDQQNLRQKRTRNSGKSDVS